MGSTTEIGDTDMSHNLELVQRISRLASLHKQRGLDDDEMEQAIELVRTLTPQRVRVLRRQRRRMLLRLFGRAGMSAIIVTVMASFGLWMFLGALLILGMMLYAPMEIIFGSFEPLFTANALRFYVTSMPVMSVLIGMYWAISLLAGEWPGSARVFVDTHLEKEF